MKVVFDTNVLLSATISEGVVHKLFSYSLTEHDLFTSGYIQQEYEEKLVRKFSYTKQEAAIASEVIFRVQTFVKPASVAIPELDDKDDLPIIGTAIRANADYLITGDKGLLKLKQYKSIVIVSPKEFANVVKLVG